MTRHQLPAMDATAEPLDLWIDRQYGVAATAMLRSISATGITKTRPGFGQTIVPIKGSVVASPVPASYDPDPDYFFHWHRDSAIIIDALRLLFLDGTLGAKALEHFADFVRFNRGLRALDGGRLVDAPSWRENVVPGFKKFLRADADLAKAAGDGVLAETRVNPNGQLDISSWPRPQNDGPALRLLTLLRWMGNGAGLETDLAADLDALVREDLAFTLRHWREPCFDLWEEENGLHYFTLRVQAAALEAGAAWLAGQGDMRSAEDCRNDAMDIRSALDDYWLDDAGFYRSRVLASGVRSAKELDIAPILATIHADGEGPRHSAADPKMHATLARLETLFDAAYAINRERPRDWAPAMGRYADDVYYSGGAYYFSTLGAAEFCFRAAAANPMDTLAWRKKGDAFLETVRAHIPASGDMSEQFDRNTGAQTSAKHLAWSYAAFISCVASRRSIG